MERLNLFVAFILAAAFVAIGMQSSSEPACDPWFEQAVLKNSRPVVVKFGAEWCPPCRAMDESLNHLQGRFPQARFVKISVDDKGELFRQYRSGSGIPQILIFRNGEVVAHERGFGGQDRLAAWLNSNLN